MALTRLMRLGIAAGIAAATVGCSDTFAPPEGLDFAAATRSCGPADGPAVVIYLASERIESLDPSAPFVRVYVDQSLETLAGRSWLLAGVNANGAAWYYSSATEFEVATIGGMRVEKVEEDNTIVGLVDLIFPDAGRIRGEFRAVWVPNTVICV